MTTTSKLKPTTRSSWKQLLVSLFAGAAVSTSASAQTPHVLSTGDFFEDFDDISDTTAWPDGFASSSPWASVPVIDAGTVPSATKVTTATTAFSTGFSRGVQRGEQNIVLLSTGGNPGNTTSAAIDLLLNFSNCNAGLLSFDAATVFNSTGNREGALNLYYTINGTDWVEITGGGLPYVATNNVVGSASIEVVLPPAINEQVDVRFRFYYYNKSSEASVSGSRPKISIDNLSITSSSSGPDTTAPELVSLTPPNGTTDADIGTPLTIRFNEPVIASTGNVQLFSVPSVGPPALVQSFLANSGSFSAVSVTFMPTSPLANDSFYYVIVDTDAFTDLAGNAFAGITSSSGWAFQTAPAAPPMIVSIYPDFDAVDVPLDNLELSITYDSNVLRGTGILHVFDIDDLDFPPTPVASYNVSDPAQVSIAGNVVTFNPPVSAMENATYYIDAPTGFLVSAGGVPSQSIGVGADLYWGFITETIDTTPPVIVSTTPANGPGASTASTLRVTYDELVALGSGPWTITFTDVTASALLYTFTQADVASVSVSGTQLTITLPTSLGFNNTYRVTVSEGVVEDTSGNIAPAITGSEWEFTTGGPFVRGQVVISQVYGGGGNAGAFFTHDFVELHNRSNAPISLDGWSVQYAGATGTNWQTTALNGLIQPGGYFLIQQAAGAGGTEALPSPDVIGTISMGASNGKVALVNGTTALIGANPLVDPVFSESISDFVGFGSANAFEGTGATPVLSNTTAAIRLVNGSQDTDDNSDDFVVGAPNPRNTSSSPFLPTVDGSGIASAINTSPSAGILNDTLLFASSAGSQVVTIDLLGTLAEETLTTVEIAVPADFGTPLVGNVSLSGPAVAGGTVGVSGQVVTVSGVSLTPSQALLVNIAGLSAPDVSLVASDNGFREFTVSSAVSGGTLTPLVESPQVRVALPMASVSTLRSVVLPSPKAYILQSEAVVTYVTPGFRNQHWIQDATAGVVIDDQSGVLGTFNRGDGILGIVGTLNEYQGLLQFGPIIAAPPANSVGNNPAPALVTLADLNANPLFYQARLVRVNGVSFQETPANFANQSIHPLEQGSDVFSFRSFTGVDYTPSAVPTGSLDLIGLVRRVGVTPEDFVSARNLADFILPVVGGGFGDWTTLYGGGLGPEFDGNGDGVPNGLAYFMGVNSTAFVANPGIVNGAITWPRDPSRTDAQFTVQTSPNLTNWTNLPQGNLDLSDPNAVTYNVPAGQAPFFVRIKIDIVQ